MRMLALSGRGSQDPHLRLGSGSHRPLDGPRFSSLTVHLEKAAASHCGLRNRIVMHLIKPEHPLHPLQGFSCSRT